MTIRQRALWNLREWLTPYEAAEYLSDESGSMTGAEVLRLSLDGHLRLCVNLPKPVSAELLDAKGTPTGRRIEALGLWELPMQGAARVFVEHEFNFSRHLPFIEIDWRKGANVTRDGASCRLPGDEGASGFSPRGSSAIPYGSSLVIRVADLKQFESDHPVAQSSQEASPSADKPLTVKERATLLTIIKALAIEAKVDLTQPWKAAESIEAGVSRIGAKLSVKTIFNHLKQIDDAVERRGKTD